MNSPIQGIDPWRSRRSILRAVAVVSLALILAQMAVAAPLIQRPTNNVIINSAPLVEMYTREGAPGGRYRILLNGRDVSDLAFFSTAEQKYHILGSSLQGLVRKGRNQLVVLRDTPLSPDLIGNETVNFLLDGPPEVVIQEARPVAGGLITVSGRADDVRGITSVKVNGTTAALQGARFSVTLTAAEDYRITATDTTGQTATATWRSTEHLPPRTVGALIANDNLPPVAVLVEDMIVDNRDDLQTYVVARNPVYQGTPNWLVGKTQFNVTSLRFGRPAVGLRSDGSQLKMIASIPQVTLPAQGTARPCVLFFCFNLPVYGDITIARADLEADVRLLVNDGRIGVELEQFRTTLTDYRLVSNWKDIGLIEGIVNDVIRKVLPGAFQAALEEPLERVLSESFAGLNTTITGTILDQAVRLELVPEAFGAVSGGLDLSAGARIVFGQGGGLRGLGYRFSGGGLPSLGDGVGGLRAGVSLDLVNLVLWKAQQARMLDLDLCGNVRTLLDDFAPDLNLQLLKIPFGDNLDAILQQIDFHLTTRPVDPPYLTLEPTSDALASLVIPGMPAAMRLDFSSLPGGFLGLNPGGTLGILDIGLRATVVADANLGQSGERQFGLDIAGDPVLGLAYDTIVIRDGEGNVVPVANPVQTLQRLESFLDIFVAPIAPAAVPMLESALGALPLPTLAGFELDLRHFGALESDVATPPALMLEGSIARSGGPDRPLDIPMPEIIRTYTQRCSTSPL